MTRSSYNLRARFVSLLGGLQPLQLLADTTAATPALRPAPGAPDIVSVTTSLVLVIGAIFLVGWLYSRAQRFRGGSAGDIRVVAVQPLGAKERIVVVQVAGKQLVVGVTSTNINTLHTFEGLAVNESAPAIGGSFATRLRAVIGSRAS
jgi:flagellar protein FliO/FliZ